MKCYSVTIQMKVMSETVLSCGAVYYSEQGQVPTFESVDEILKGNSTPMKAICKLKV